MCLSTTNILIFILISTFDFTIETNKNFLHSPLKNYSFATTHLINFNGNFSRGTRNIDMCYYLMIKLEDEKYKLCVQINDDLYSLAEQSMKVTVVKNSLRKDVNINDVGIVFAKGYIIGHPYTSSLNGYIENERFYGCIRLNSRIFYVEEILKHKEVVKAYRENLILQDAIIYETSSNDLGGFINFKNDMLDIYNSSRNIKIQNFRYENRIYGKVCPLFIFIDNSFYKKISRENYKDAIRTVFLSISNADSLFRSTDFDEDGVPDNIGFKIKDIHIADSPEVNLILPYTEEPTNGRYYLEKFTTLQILCDYCLGVAFTGQPFENKVLGLSFTAVLQQRSYLYPLPVGGICDSSEELGVCLNSLVVTYTLTNGVRAPQFIADISLTHELGHSFGSDHDGRECEGYLMSSHTQRGFSLKNFMFSSCSKKQMLRILKVRSNCLEVTNDVFCGNGIVEENEDCDCGFYYDCIENDMCCIPRDSKGPGCKVKLNEFQCHPSQGLCCSESCQFKDLSSFGLSCTNFNIRCPSFDAICGIRGKCIKNQCHNLECTRIGLEECFCRSKTNECITCCRMPDGKCLSAPKATQIMIVSDAFLFNALKFNQENITKILPVDVVQVYCSNNNCISLKFKVFKEGEYCLSRGHLGRCESSNCVIPKPRKNINPLLEKYLRKGSKELRSNASVCYFKIFVLIPSGLIYFSKKFL